MPNPSDVRREKGLARHTVDQLLLVDLIRYAVSSCRYLWLARVRRRLRTLDGRPAVATSTVSHNLRGLRDLAVNRSLFLIRPLSVIESLGVDSDLLVVGPRTEGEILALVGHGFERSHIRALDLISYSPWVELGDLHEMPFPDDSFDAIVLGWVLAYSDDRSRAAAEILRVVRPGGVVAIGVEWNARTDEEIVAEAGYLPGSATRIGSSGEILALFEPWVDQVILAQDAPRGGDQEVAALLAIFTVRSCPEARP
jgi:SAM-dependent methyltransferase